MDVSFAPAYEPGRSPDDYCGSPLANYGNQWWLAESGARVGLGKDGQYLHVDPARRIGIVRLGTAQGSHSWLGHFQQLATNTP